jgi:hypothetical protein
MGLILLATVAPVLAIPVILWVFKNYPRLGCAAFALLAVSTLFAMLTFSHFFPHCHAGFTGHVICQNSD